MSSAHPSPRPEPLHRGGWFALVIVGSILALLGGTLAGSVAAAATLFSESAGVITTRPVDAATTGYALTTPSADLARYPVGSDIRLVLTVGEDGGAPVFVGVGPSEDVAAYLQDVHIAEVDGLRTSPTTQLTTRDIPGSARPQAPASQDFWVAVDSGAGIRNIDLQLEPGRWTAVIMNADGSAGVDTAVSVGIDAPWVAPVVGAVTAVAGVLLTLGLILIMLGAFGWGRGQPLTTTPMSGPYPVAVIGELLSPPSRGLWLAKWLLALPHWIVLALLSVGFVVSTIFAWFAILITGRYPRSLFAFNVGFLRWAWRVSFYAYSALGTDRYPPFSLQRTDYPADFDVAYPDRLSRGLVLVKAWLLALPHLLIVGVLTGGVAWGMGVWGGSSGSGASLLTLLVLVAAVILLFTARYPAALFAFVMGVNRWALRVAAYVALMRDEYPPFRLDQGPLEPEATPAEAPAVAKG